MKSLELAICLLFVLAVFFAFGMYLYSAIVLLIAFLLIDRVKKYDKNRAKKLNYIGIGIVIFVIILYLITAFLAYTLLSGLLGIKMTKATNNSGYWQQVNSSNLPHANSSLQPTSYYNSSDNTFYCKSGDNSICSALIKNCTDVKLKLYGINILYGSYSQTINITKNGQSCKVVYNVTDVNVTKEVMLKDVSMTCNLPLLNGEVPEGLSPSEYCQFYEVSLTPNNA